MTASKKFIGYYAHHHGTGHIVKAAEIVNHIKVPTKLLSSANKPDGLSERHQFISLPTDVDKASESGESLSYLHFAATKSIAINSRMNTIVESLRDVRVLMVDVSVEIVQLARLLSIPTAVMRMHGNRNDAAHLLAYESAEILIAPFPEELEQPSTPDWVREKTSYAGGFSKHQGRDMISTDEAKRQIGVDAKTVVVMTSLGGDGLSLDTVIKLADNTPDWHWVVVGKTDAALSAMPANVRIEGIVKDTWPFLRAADVVIGSAGQNTVMEIATANKPAVIIPEPRPYDEQEEKANALKRARLATVYPTVDVLLQERDLSNILDEVSREDTNMSRLLSPDGSAIIADVLKRLYDSSEWRA